MKIYSNKNKRIWYDTKLKFWTLQTLDTQGNQVGDVDYTVLKQSAFKWLKE